MLADEINRASPKTQSALLEAMEERQVTVDGTTYPLGPPFMVIATQNPIEHEGTYPLPESQLDRFLMRISIGYPDRDAELEILDTHGGARARSTTSGRWSTAAEVAAMIARGAHACTSRRALKAYLVDLAEASRRHPALALGMSPRATLSLQRATRARAAAQGRNYVMPDDVKALAGPVLAHRLMLTPEAQLQGIRRGATSSTTCSAACRCHQDELRESARVTGARLDSMLTRAGWATLGAAGVLVVVRPSVRHLRAVRRRRGARRPRDRVARRACAPTRLRLEVAREVIPAQVHAGSRAGSSCGATNLARRRTPGAAAARSGVGHARRRCCLGSSRPQGAGLGPPTGCRPTSAGVIGIGPLDGGDRRSVRPHRGHDRGGHGHRAHRLPAGRRDPAAPPDASATIRTPAPSTRTPLGREGEDFYALRPYVVGDDLRRVHWPSTARHDELMVRQDELPWQGRATVLLDVRRGAHTPETPRARGVGGREHHHRVLAPADLARLLVTDGTDSGFAAGHPHVEAIMEHLAMVSLSGTASMRSVIESLAAHRRGRRRSRGRRRERADRGDGRVRSVAAAVLVRHGCCVR